ncbi:MAG: hypothetical protein P4L75_05905 [Clostridia bacterium]|nr:hypothetical protein [Clostridia bacterium]MDR3644930.1 hypothetical protein [Clostridia bacterium]
MKWNKLREFSEGKGWVFRNETVFGEHDGLLFSIALVRHKNSATYRLTVAFAEDSSRTPKELEAQIREFRKSGNSVRALRNAKVTGNTLVFTVGGGFGSIENRLIEGINRLPSLMKELNLRQDDHCAYCGGAGCDQKIAFENRLAVWVHSSCYREQLSMLEEQTHQQQELQGGLYLFGIVGALAGTALGTVISAAALALKLGRLSYLTYLLTVFLAFKGYKLLAKRITKLTPVIITVFTVIFAAVSALVSPFLVDLFEYGMSARSAAASVRLLLYSSDSFRGDLIENTIVALVVTVIALASMWYRMSYTPEDVLEDMRNARIG